MPRRSKRNSGFSLVEVLCAVAVAASAIAVLTSGVGGSIKGANKLDQHLGAEYAQQVQLELYELEGLQIGAVECERSSAPVFLRAKNNEEAFLIRSGPSNIELSMSRALKYIQDRA